MDKIKIEYNLPEDNLHVIPFNDTHEHDISYTCWCKPTPNPIATKIYIHHAWDNREQEENFSPTNIKENLIISKKYRILPKEEPEEFYIATYNTFPEAEKAAKELCMKHRISVEIVELQATVTYNPSVLITKT